MDQKQLTNLFLKFHNRKASPEEIDSLNKLLTQHDSEAEIKDIIENVFNTLSVTDIKNVALKEAESTYQKIILHPREQENVRKLRPIMSAAAAILIFVMGYIFILIYQNKNVSISKNTEVVKAKPAVILKLGSGKSIDLSAEDAEKSAKEGGVTISRAKNGDLIYAADQQEHLSQQNVLSTPNGRTFNFTLPDGTRVWLNAASTLTYTTGLLDKGIRRVKMFGEGYFEVSKDKLHPFVVETANQSVRVLGTHFNIRSYNEDEVFTTLMEGSIEVRTANDQNLIKPGEQSSLVSGHLMVAKTDVNRTIAWKNGFFEFYNDDLTTIIEELQRWYGINADLKNMPAIKFTGIIPRSKELTEVLKILKVVGDINLVMKEGRLQMAK